MKILKIFGLVVGVHVLALMLIFANPGCSSTNKPAPAPADTAPKEEASPAAVALPSTNSGAATAITAAPEGSTPSAVDYPPSPTVRFSPTRPGTAAASALETQPVSGVTPASTYAVKPGDSLWSIAHKNHISIAELAVANNMKQAASIRIGQKLIIPAQSVPAATTSAAPEPVQKTPADVAPVSKGSGTPVKHVIKPGETLGGIARKYGVKLGDLAALNAIADPAKIRPGQELTIPGWKSPAGTGATNRSSHTAAAAAPAVNPTTTTPAMTPPAATNPPAGEVPTLVLPAPEQESDSATKSTNSEPPVIQVEEKK